MPRTVSVGSLKQQIRERCDQLNSPFISESELTSMVSISYAEFYNKVVVLYEDYYLGFATLNTQPQTQIYNLPPNFWKLKGVDLIRSPNRHLELDKFPWRERNRDSQAFSASDVYTNLRYRINGNTLMFNVIPNSPQEIRIWYVPTAEKLLSDTQEIDGHNGYEEVIILDVCAKIALKCEEHQSRKDFLQSKSYLLDSMEDEAANRDIESPSEVTDERGLVRGYKYWGY